MIKNIQSLVNAQVSVNRAVFEGNYPQEPGDHEPRPDYIRACCQDAIKDLQEWLRKDKKQQRRAEIKKAKALCECGSGKRHIDCCISRISDRLGWPEYLKKLRKQVDKL